MSLRLHVEHGAAQEAVEIVRVILGVFNEHSSCERDRVHVADSFHGRALCGEGHDGYSVLHWPDIEFQIGCGNLCLDCLRTILNQFSRAARCFSAWPGMEGASRKLSETLAALTADGGTDD